MTALNYAAQYGYIDYVKYLVGECKAIVDFTDKVCCAFVEEMIFFGKCVNAEIIRVCCVFVRNESPCHILLLLLSFAFGLTLFDL